MCCYFHNVKGNFKLIMGRKKRVNGPHSFISLEPILYYNTSSWHLNFLWLILSDHYYVHQMPISSNDWLELRAPFYKTDGFNHVAPNWCRIDNKALWKLGLNRHFLVIVSNGHFVLLAHLQFCCNGLYRESDEENNMKCRRP